MLIGVLGAVLIPLGAAPLAPINSAEGINALATLLTAFVSALTVTGVTGYLGRRRNKRQAAQISHMQAAIEDTREQVTNHHSTNLRDDVTQVAEMQAAVMDMITELNKENEARTDRADLKNAERFSELAGRMGTIDRRIATLDERLAATQGNSHSTHARLFERIEKLEEDKEKEE